MAAADSQGFETSRLSQVLNESAWALFKGQSKTRNIASPKLEWIHSSRTSILTSIARVLNLLGHHENLNNESC